VSEPNETRGEKSSDGMSDISTVSGR